MTDLKNWYVTYRMLHTRGLPKWPKMAVTETGHVFGYVENAKMAQLVQPRDPSLPQPFRQPLILENFKIKWFI